MKRSRDSMEAMPDVPSLKPDSDMDNRIKLPGFGLPFNDWGENEEESKFFSAVEDWDHSPMTIRERCMLAFINNVTDKPNWNLKVWDEEIIAKWEKEAIELDWEAAGWKDGDMSQEMFAYCISELREKATFYEKTGMVPVLDISSCIIKSDSAIPTDLNNALREAVATLEGIPDVQKDWHPGSDGKVLDLVHPSLFPLVYHRSRILPDSTISVDDCMQHIGKGEVVAITISAKFDSGNERDKLWSAHYQWLPCNVSFPDGENAKIVSYINNLHPMDHKSLYTVIEQLITKAVPLWNIAMQWHGNAEHEGQRVPCEAVAYRNPDSPYPERPSEWRHHYADPSNPAHMDQCWRYEWEQEHHTLIRPEPREYQPLTYTDENIGHPFTFLGDKEKKLQVIVKLANIHLTPDKPEYGGGSWHIEGQLNEHIVASALYYYDNYNITDSRLYFRTKINGYELTEGDMDYEQGDYEGIERIWGIEQFSSQIQDLGSVLTNEGRLIAFPNGFQHRVGPFKLADPTKPGHRKIIALFLVDPNIPIISTANVPPQQRDWWLRELAHEKKTRIGALPAELFDMVGKEVEDFPIGLDEAKKIREELMAERGRLDQNVEEVVKDYEFNFCEH